ncbi:hypothetical protein WMF04_47320 [Sorangium sp. So ce260]|uniref:hypothetical protein n=1 Tax=Sorangium sp. So ce260 TaxID=3133291 RepID=UPI003F63681D
MPEDILLSTFEKAPLLDACDVQPHRVDNGAGTIDHGLSIRMPFRDLAWVTAARSGGKAVALGVRAAVAARLDVAHETSAALGGQRFELLDCTVLARTAAPLWTYVARAAFLSALGEDSDMALPRPRSRTQRQNDEKRR